MRIVIDLSEEQVLLTEPGDFGRFSVMVEGAGPRSLGEVVHASGLGRVKADGEHIVVDPMALRALAGAAATTEWDAGFDAMCSYAAGKGWIEDDGGILAHVEWEDGPR